MIVHLIGSSQSRKKANHSRIVDSIKNNDAVLLPDDFSGSWEDRLDAHLESMARADAVIIEATGRDFFHGFFAAFAMEHKKPLLIVTSDKEGEHPLAAIQGRNCQVVTYSTGDELVAIIDRFIKDNTIYTKDLRFNLFIDRPIYNYLRTISDQTGKNKSEIIRDLINREINKP